MKKTVRYVDEDTLEIMERVIDDGTQENSVEEGITIAKFTDAISCEPEEFMNKYETYKKAEKEFNELYEPIKANLIKLHEDYPETVKTVIIGNVRLTYVSPSTKTIIDSKKLKEEEPAIAEKYSKTSNVKANIRLSDRI